MEKAIFLGSFNPPHKGHYNALKSVISYFNEHPMGLFDQIHIIPCWQNPNKDRSIDFYDRYKMCKLEFAALPDNCVVDDIEATVKPTYTYELIDYLKQNKDKIIGDDFWWIITEETIEELIDGKWKESERLLKENKFIILYPAEERPYVSFKVNDYFEEIDKWPGDYQYVPLIGSMDIHSTQIRENLYTNEKYDDCMTKETKSYIFDRKLYRKI